jgi:hypothetical protein
MKDQLKLLESRINNEADRLYGKWRKQMDLLEKSVLAKVRKGGIDAYDVYALGKQLEAFEAYVAICEEEGNTNLLGQLPKVAYDVITAVHGVSVLPVIASVQPIDEERGNVYFKNIRSATTRGSQTAGGTLVDPRSQIVTPSGYSSNHIAAEVGASTGGTPGTSYNFTLAAKPVRSETVKITIQDDAATYCQDDGNGKLLGIGVFGTINYITGAVALTFAVAPAANKNILVEYQQNYELSSDLPQIDTFFDSKGIQARIYALKGTIGMLQSFGMKKRFGLMAEDEMAKDLVQEVNREIGGDLIRKMRAAAVGTTTFSKTPPAASISYFEHKQTYKDKLAEAEGVLVGNAGRGTVSLIIAGKDHASVIQTLPGFKKLYDGNGLGAHVFGELDGVPVVRVLESNILGAGEGMAVWKGTSPFEAAAVYAPFMPLAVTSTLPQAPNPLSSMKAAAVWAGVETLVPNYVTKFDVTA